ncbi:rodlin [Streptomyces varsoviensis]|uniref:rodlin n=1 Tax=Streptomyces varsoviensis TaxID=67373 RepID=UPI0033CCA129
MIKKVLATAALTVSAVGSIAGPAMAVADDDTVNNGNAASQSYGNTHTGGYMSPQIGLIQGSLNKPCIGLGKLGAQSIVGLVNVGVQDIPILTSQQQQTCVENSSIKDGDDPLSHLIEEIPILSGNGSANASANRAHH